MKNQPQQKQRIIVCVLGLVCLLMSGMLYANSRVIGKIDTVGDGKASIEPDQYFGAYREMVTDMRVKVHGGYIRVTRDWDNGQWYINRRWARLQPTEGSTPAVIQEDGTPNGNLSTINAFYRGAERFERSGTNLYVHYLDPQETIRVIETGGYRWQNRDGDWISYNAERRMVEFGDRSGNVYTPIYDAEQERLLGLKDQDEQQLLWYDYNGSGQVTAVRDYGDRQVQYRYDGDKLNEVILPDSGTWKYSYQGELLKSKTDARGRVHTFHYGQCNGQLNSTVPQVTLAMDSGSTPGGGTSYAIDSPITASDSLVVLCGITDQDGVGESYTYDYDKNKRQFYKRVKTGSGKVSEYWYDYEGDVIRVDRNGVTTLKIDKNGRTHIHTDAGGLQTKKSYDQWDNLIREEYPDGSTRSTTYDSQHNQPVLEVDEEGRITERQLDEKGRISLLIEAKGTPVERKTGYTYDEHGNLASVTRHGDDDESSTDDVIVKYKYDTHGNAIEVTDAESNVTKYSYDGGGFILTVTNPLEHTTTYTRDGVGRLKSKTDALEHTTNYQYNDGGDLIKITDALTQTNEFSYDIRGNRIQAKDAYENATKLVYDVNNKLIKKENAIGVGNTRQYDSHGSLTKNKDPFGNVTHIEYHPEGSTQQPQNGARMPGIVHYPTFTEKNEYDNRYRVIRIIKQLSEDEQHISQAQYDRAGNRTQVTDPEGMVTKYHYDALNRLIEVIYPLEQSTKFEYDNRDNLTKVTDPNGHATSYVYDKNNRKTQEILPLGQTITYTYDEAGRLAQIEDAAGRITKNGYDDAGRHTEQQHYAAGEETPERMGTFTYDAVGNLKTYSSGTISASYQYDKNNRKISETTNYGTFSLTHKYSYDAAGNKISYTGPDNVTVNYIRDKGRLSRMELPGEGGGELYYNSYKWNAPTRITFPGGGRRLYEYNPLMQPSSIQGMDPGLNAQLDIQYSYDKTGNITQRSTKEVNEVERKTYTYKYDDLQRLTQAQAPDETEGWDYDPNGNRTSDLLSPGTWEYDDNDRLKSSPKGDWQYDESGSPTQKTKGGDTFNYHYNAGNRLAKVTDKTYTVIAEYQYDPMGRRVKKVTETGTIYFHYTDEGLAGEYDQDGNPIRQYGYAPDSTWSTDPLYQKTANGYAYYFTDHLGTPQQLMQKNGAVVWKAKYRAFGEIRSEEKQNGWDNPLRFPGQYYDSETGTYYNYFRDYDPGIGRYVEGDPIGLQGGMNVFLYAAADPIRKNDVNGLGPKPAQNPWNVFQGNLSRQGRYTNSTAARREYRQNQLNKMGRGNSGLKESLEGIPNRTNSHYGPPSGGIDGTLPDVESMDPVCYARYNSQIERNRIALDNYYYNFNPGECGGKFYWSYITSVRATMFGACYSATPIVFSKNPPSPLLIGPANASSWVVSGVVYKVGTMCCFGKGDDQFW